LATPAAAHGDEYRRTRHAIRTGDPDESQRAIRASRSDSIKYVMPMAMFDAQ
jgi:hypothetical protein